MTLIGSLKRLFGGRRGPAPDWRVEGRRPRGASVGLDFSEAWRLPEGGVAYLRSSGPREAVFAWRPWGSPDMPVTAGGLYRFSVLAAVHRCRAELVISLKDAAGRTLDEQRRGVSPSARGGRERSAYHLIEAEFRAPPGAERLTVAFRKGGAEPGQDSFIFLAEPRFEPVEESAAPQAAAPADRPASPVAWAPHKAAEAYNRRHDAEARHLAACRNWLHRAAKGQTPPDLTMLNAALEAGRIGRTELPRLSFPVVEIPRVVVVIEVGDDPELLWLTLAGLLFAANLADFKVHVVAQDEAQARTAETLAEGIEVFQAPDNPAVGAVAVAFGAAMADNVVLMEPGFEAVAGWLDELIAAAEGFEAGGFAPRLVDAHGRLPGGGNPHDPWFGYVRPVETGFPLMVSWDFTDQLGVDVNSAATARELADAVHGRLRETGLPVLATPTAELRRLKGAPEPAAIAFVAVPVPQPAFRVLFIDQEAPTVDMDAGGYAAFQEMRMLQALGAKVDFLPRNLAWMDRHTIALQRAGIECHYTPFVRSFDQFLQEKAGDYDVIFVMRYKIAALVQAALAGLERRPKLVLNLADLHFLREIREAAVGTPGFDLERARATQAAELAAIAGSDLTLTYSDVEAAVIARHTGEPDKVALAPWAVETFFQDIPPFSIYRFPDTDGLMFLGGFGHPPNAQAVIRFVGEVMPRLAAELPDAKLRIVGSKPTPEVLGLAGSQVEVLGYVPDLDEVFAKSRIFVAPLLAGAGLKGKVMEALARGVPMVLSPIAAEGTGLVDGEHCLIARTAEEQVAAIIRLYGDDELWTRMALSCMKLARERFSLAVAVETMRAAMGRIGIETPSEHQLHYRRALPDPNRSAGSAPAVMRLP